MHACLQPVSFLVKDLPGTIWELKSRLSVTVGKIKTTLDVLIGVPPGVQILVYEGQWLHSGQTLLDYGITEGDTVWLIPEQSGGETPHAPFALATASSTLHDSSVGCI